ncbi:hypothetical protein FCV25MIE_32319 [Fagus crenata]
MGLSKDMGWFSVVETWITALAKIALSSLCRKPKTVANRNKGGVSYPQVAIYGMRATLSFNKNQLCLHLPGYGRFRQSHSHPISCLHLQGYSAATGVVVTQSRAFTYRDTV